MSSRLVDLYNSTGQSAWLDNLQRSYVTSGYLSELIAQGVRGLTSNPTIFQKAIQNSSDYDEQFFSELGNGLTIAEIYWKMVTKDIVGASDLFSHLYEESKMIDGYVSVEVDPRLSRDTKGTIDAARDLRDIINRPNVMIKIPATVDGLPAITQMIAEGCPVNVTLIFSLERYRQVIDAYIAGLEQRADSNQPLEAVHSVASFFISRVDSEIDARLTQNSHSDASQLMGTSAINQARLAYQIYREQFSSSRWAHLAQKGAATQRPLWASTSTKNPAYSDTMYIDELIGPDTVNTIPEATMHAFIDHGNVSATVEKDLARTQHQWSLLQTYGVDTDAVAQKLEEDGLKAFVQSFEDLMESLDQKSHEAL
jgi:transaldolase